jgi:hypothetical protein
MIKTNKEKLKQYNDKWLDSNAVGRIIMTFTNPLGLLVTNPFFAILAWLLLAFFLGASFVGFYPFTMCVFVTVFTMGIIHHIDIPESITRNVNTLFLEN